MSGAIRIAGLVSVAVLATGALPALAEVEFGDDDGIPQEPYVEIVAGAGVMDGCDDVSERFCPDDPMLPGEAAAALIRTAQAVGTAPRLNIAPAASLLANALTGRGLIPGCPSEQPCHAAAITRGGAAKGLVHALGLDAPEDFDIPWDDTVDRSYHHAARVMAHQELVDVTASSFDGEVSLTRAGFAEMLARSLTDDPCTSNPFTAGRVESLQAAHPGQSFTAYVYDIDTGCAHWMNPDQRLRTASVLKVMVMAGALLEAQDDGRQVTDSEWEAMVPMITESANWPVRSLWRRFGASPWFSRQTEVFGLDETTAVGDGGAAWGTSRTSAKDQADLLRQVLLGEWGPLDDESRRLARELMTSVVESQTWGVSSGVPEGWTVAQKNGFAGGVANSVGYVAGTDGEAGYVVAILTNGWPGWRAGVDTVEEIGGWVSAEFAR